MVAEPTTDILWEQLEGGVATLTLNRPERRNAMNHALGRRLGDAIARCAADDAVRVIILTGSGGVAFCAGADMAERVSDFQAEGPGGTDYAGRQLEACAKPVIAAINGYCYGGGAQLATMCDFRIASATASFRFPGAEYGLVVGASYLPRAVGAAMAKELILTARRWDAAEALRIGFVNRLTEPDELLPTVTDLARQIAANSPIAVQHSKAVIDTATLVPAALEQQAEANRQLRAGDDHRDRFRDAARRITGR